MLNRYPEKTADILVTLRQFPREMTSFHREMRNERRKSILMTCHYPDLGSASEGIFSFSPDQKHYTDLASDTSSVWNFRARSSDDIMGLPVAPNYGMCFLRRKKKKQKWKTAHPEGAAYPTPPSMGPIFVGRGRVISGRLANRFGSRFGTKTNLYLFY